MNWPIVWSEINAIQQAILSAASPCQSGGAQTSVCIGGTTPMTFISGITGVSVIDGGAGYYIDIPAVKFIPPYNVIIPGEDLATGTVITNGSRILSINITGGGHGYEPVLASANITSMTGSGAVLSVIVGADTSVYGISVITAGTGYNVNDTVNIVRAVAPNVLYVNAVASIGSVDINGAILSINVTVAGTGYQPSVTQAQIVSTLNSNIPYITGSGFNGTVLTNSSGVIQSVTILSGGAGYTNLPPQLIISDPGTGFTSTVSLSGSSVDTITILTNGSNYTQNATGSVINPPTGPSPATPAQVQLTIPVNTFGTNPNLYYQVWAGTITNCGIQNQLNFVMSYFSQLGYTVNLSTNPATGTTLQWCICWC
jgi:hypothetical protein